MAVRFSSTLPKLCIDFMDAVSAAFLVPHVANEKSRRQTIPSISPETPFCQTRLPWLELMGLLGTENGRTL
jgi:hypothetical protein